MRRSSPGSTPPMGDSPRLIASTFQPDVTESRCTTTTSGGSCPRIGALARSAAIGVPTMPGPITTIFLTCHSRPSALSGICVIPGFDKGDLCRERSRGRARTGKQPGPRPIDELSEPKLQTQQSPQAPAECALLAHELGDGAVIEQSAGPGGRRQEDVMEKITRWSAGPHMDWDGEAHFVLSRPNL